VVHPGQPWQTGAGGDLGGHQVTAMYWDSV
jgi:hypothetical protein